MYSPGGQLGDDEVSDSSVNSVCCRAAPDVTSRDAPALAASLIGHVPSMAPVTAACGFARE